MIPILRSYILLVLILATRFVLSLPVPFVIDETHLLRHPDTTLTLSKKTTREQAVDVQFIKQKPQNQLEHLRPISEVLRSIGVVDPVLMTETLPQQVLWSPSLDPSVSVNTTSATPPFPVPYPSSPAISNNVDGSARGVSIAITVIICLFLSAIVLFWYRSPILALCPRKKSNPNTSSELNDETADHQALRSDLKSHFSIDDCSDRQTHNSHGIGSKQNLPPFKFPPLVSVETPEMSHPSLVVNPPKLIHSSPTLPPELLAIARTQGPIYTNQLQPSTQLQCSKDGAERSIAAAASRTSFLTHSASCHSRTLSAPMPGQTRPTSGSTITTSSDSEWDITAAYSGPRFDRTRSNGGFSRVSMDSRDLGKMLV